jgi:hypothetical protein
MLDIGVGFWQGRSTGRSADFCQKSKSNPRDGHPCIRAVSQTYITIRTCHLPSSTSDTMYRHAYCILQQRSKVILGDIRHVRSPLLMGRTGSARVQPSVPPGSDKKRQTHAARTDTHNCSGKVFIMSVLVLLKLTWHNILWISHHWISFGKYFNSGTHWAGSGSRTVF